MISVNTKEEIILKGIPASHGIAIGSVYLYLIDIPVVEERSINENEIAGELDRFSRAIEKSLKELQKIYSFAQVKMGDAKAKILEWQLMVLEDHYLIEAIKRRLQSEKKNLEYIVSDEIGKYAALMLKAQDEYMHERAYDMEGLKNRIIRNSLQKRLISKLEGSLIVVAHTLTDADTIILSRNHILGFVTDMGGITSHAALIARQLKLPAIVGLGDVSRSVVTGDTLLMDGYSGTLIIHPTQKHIEEYEKKRERMLKFEHKLIAYKDLLAETKDGHRIELSANIGLPEEIEYVVVQGSQGVGLYRSENMLIDRDDFPSEEEQYLEYKNIADRLYPNRVIMRTFDIGGDKIAPETAEEANPFLGWRGIRISLDQPDFFLSQLRAILRASTRKNIAIMFPMITSITEVKKAKEYLRKAKAELKAKNIKFHDKIPVGVMIEVPSAALMTSVIAPEVDFVSIGSNDLTQYLLAVDRGNKLVAKMYRELEPSVLITIKHIVNAGHKHGIWVGICGEMAGNPLATPILVGLGMDELSVIPSILPEIKKIIRSINYEHAQEIAQTVLQFSTANEVESYMRRIFKKEFTDIPLDNF